MPGGVGAGHRAQHHRRADLDVGEFLAVDLGVDQAGEQVVFRGLTARGDQVFGDLVNPQCALDLHLSRVAPTEQHRVGPGLRLVGAVRDLGAEFLRDAEHVAEHLNRQVLGDVLDEVDVGTLAGLLGCSGHDPPRP